MRVSSRRARDNGQLDVHDERLDLAVTTGPFGGATEARMIQVVFLVTLFVVNAYLLNQVRKPSKWLGRLFLRNMNERHSQVTDWGLSHVDVGEQRAILDVGCGGGRTIAKLAALAPRAKVVGIDYADGSIAESRAHNADRIASGRVEIVRASVDDLPGPSARFDLVTAVETHYYWPNMVGALTEIRRVLRPGAKLVLIAETYRDGRFGWAARLAMAPLRAALLTAEEHERRLAAAGFEAIEVSTEQQRGWICVVGTAPAT
jgi:SAM-dependent methyltransferase